MLLFAPFGRSAGMTIISILRNGRLITESTRLSAVVLQLAIIFSVVPLCSSVELLCQTLPDATLSLDVYLRAKEGKKEKTGDTYFGSLLSTSRAHLLFVTSHSSSALAFVREKSAGK